MTEQNPPLLWVLDFVAPTFQVLGQETTLTGDLLIASRQLWNLLHGEEVLSIFIGPGVVKGRVFIKGHQVDVEFLVGAAVFNPTEMRPGEPVPLLDILYPEVLDPLEKTTSEHVQKILRTLVVRKGSVSDPKRIITQVSGSELPRTLVAEEYMVTQKVSFISGMNKARFLLGGQKSRLYAPFKEALQRGTFNNTAKIWTFRIDKKNFDPFKPFPFREWIVIEMQSDFTGSPSDASQLIDEEYTSVLKYLTGNLEYFVF
jgi:hypothetical protein